MQRSMDSSRNGTTQDFQKLLEKPVRFRRMQKIAQKSPEHSSLDIFGNAWKFLANLEDSGKIKRRDDDL